MSYTFVKAAFGYPGGKTKSLKHILPYLNETPHTKFVDVFGGTGVVIMNKEKVELNVYNDAYSGITDFYICMREPDLYARLVELVDEMCSGYEFWDYCAETWPNCTDRIERAARWYVMTKMSFANLGRHYGRAKQSGNQPRKWMNKFEAFHDVHVAFKNIVIENMDWRTIFKYYDTDDTLFYCDPPYLATDAGSYRPRGAKDLSWNSCDHEEFLATIFDLQGCAFVSTYDNPMYSEQPWDDTHVWDVNVTISNMGDETQDNKSAERPTAKEYLFMKDFNYAR